MNDSIKISIITICKNSEATISKSIESVVSQTYSNIEYIIIDGASNDNTINIVKKYESKISKITSEVDQGIYDAMNKGVKSSTGDYLFFLNADDFLISENSISNFVEFINSKSLEPADIYYGKVLIFNNENGSGNLWSAAKVSKFSLYRGSIPHPATFYRSDSFIKCGLFNTNYKISGDYEWFVRALLIHSLSFSQSEIIVSVFNKGGISTNQNYHLSIEKEKDEIHKTYYNYWERKYYNIRWFIKKNLF